MISFLWEDKRFAIAIYDRGIVGIDTFEHGITAKQWSFAAREVTWYDRGIRAKKPDVKLA